MASKLALSGYFWRSSRTLAALLSAAQMTRHPACSDSVFWDSSFSNTVIKVPDRNEKQPRVKRTKERMQTCVQLYSHTMGLLHLWYSSSHKKLYKLVAYTELLLYKSDVLRTQKDLRPWYRRTTQKKSLLQGKMHGFGNYAVGKKYRSFQNGPP